MPTAHHCLDSFRVGRMARQMPAAIPALRYADRLLEIRDLVRRLTSDRRPLPSTVSRQSSRQPFSPQLYGNGHHDVQPGALINQRYQIVRQVGQGGMGAFIWGSGEGSQAPSARTTPSPALIYTTTAPTVAAEWEKAARGADGRIYPWGNTWDTKLANSSESGLQKTMLVGSYPDGASPYGALNMAGNVWEWCATQWGKNYPYKPEDEWQVPYLEANADNRVLRGGSVWDNRTFVRGTYRSNINPRDRYGFGLRVVRSDT